MLLARRLPRERLINFRFGSSFFSKTDSPPNIPAIPHTIAAYGHTWQDEYEWLRSRPQEAQRALQREAVHLRRQADALGLSQLASQLREECLAVLPDSVEGKPERIGGYEYYVRQTQDRPLQSYLRRQVKCLNAQGSGDSISPSVPLREEVVLDTNELTEIYGEDASVDQLKLSKCGNLLAFTMAHNGHDDLHAAFVRDLTTEQIYKQPLLNNVISIEWAADGKTILATQPDTLGRPARVVAAPADLQTTTKNSRKQQKPVDKSASRLKSTVQVLFEESDPRFFVELQRSKDWCYLAININSKTSSEVHLLPADGPITPSSLRCVQLRRPGLEYFLEHRKGKLYILSNARGAENYALFSISVDDMGLGEQGWQVLIPEAPGTALEDLDVFESGLVVDQRVLGRPQIRVFPAKVLDSSNKIDNSALNEPLLRASATPAPSISSDPTQNSSIDEISGYIIPLPEWAMSVVPGANGDYWSNTTRLILSSPIHPDQTVDWNLATKQWEDTSSQEQGVNTTKDKNENDHPNVPAHDISWTDQATTGYKPKEYVCHRVWAPTRDPDGASELSTRDALKLPLTLLHAANLGPLDGSHPCLIVVYGAYGHNLPLDFVPERLPLLNRGWVVALVHARGGGELGRRWHAAGRGPQLKRNSAADVESAAEYLTIQGYSREGRIGIEATSAGAVAAGGALNVCPRYFGAAVLESPFVDVLSTMCDPDLPLTQHEYDEFGDPSTQEGFKGLQEICPYHNLKKGLQYPPVMITCSTSDERVPYWGPLKYAARLRAAQQGLSRHSRSKAGVLVVADAHQGHLPSERERYDIKLFQYAFLMSIIQS